MNILIALDNKKVKNEIDKIYREQVYKYDITYQEGVIELLSRTEDEYILITRDNLQGNLNNMTYAKQIKVANKKTRVIYIVESLNENYKEFLFANEIFNIIEGDLIEIEIIKNLIENGKDIVYKLSKDNKEVSKNLIQQDKQIISKKIISVFGTSGSGKSFLCTQISKKISEDLNLSISLLDMDIQNPSIDIIGDIGENKIGLTELMEDIDSGVDINNNLNKYLKNNNKNNNLKYLTSNISLYNCQNKISKYYYNKIFKIIENKSDFMFIDLPSNPFLDIVKYTLEYSTNILFVINPNYISLRQALKYLELLSKTWDIPKNKIIIIINKIQKNSLDKIQIESILNDYKVIMSLNYMEDIESYINGATYKININLDMEKLYQTLGINKKSKKIVKLNPFEYLKRREN